MVIKITQAEVRKLVGAALHLDPETFYIEITDCAPAAARQAIDILHALRDATATFPLYHSSQKISCIKMFRDGCPKAPDHEGNFYSVVGLADAKWAVENVAVAIRNLELTGNLR